ncbi:serine carboxypeptidase-like 13 [Rutidosis leptorrhynchoides]|uniref:serine carboxypeptidase-like 13 n=1 Tax=Rutidosis leptorrhynchoides TaxID=125765 RepID=UPI003A993DA8
MLEPKNKMKMNISMILMIMFILLQSHILPFSHSKSTVKNLPGFIGNLPFTLETGYVGVGEDEEIQLFYYFVESQGNPKQDPLFFYFTGGPGTSAIISLFNQIGPLNFEYTNDTRSDAKLEVNPYSWTKMANMVFIDIPVGTGFSYAKTSQSWRSSDSLVVSNAYEFIRKWFKNHPAFLSNPLYITGISYMGLVVPRVTSAIYSGNEQGIHPKLNIKGYLLVNPFTDRFINLNTRYAYANRAALIEDELYETAKKNCGGNFINVDRNNTLCLNSIAPMNDCIAQININSILDPLCNNTDPKQFCRDSIYSYSNIWANTESVQEALHVRMGRVKNFQFSNTSIRGEFGIVNGTYYSDDIFGSVSIHKQLTTKNCHALIINADLDFNFPYVGTRQWINSLKLSVESIWKPWFVRNQVAGYQKTYTEANYTLLYAFIKGAGHSVARYKPEEAQFIVETWLASQTD